MGPDWGLVSGGALTAAYVGSIYLCDWSGRERDSWASIARRTAGVTAVTAGGLLACLRSGVSASQLGLGGAELWRDLAAPLGLTALLFLGPLCQEAWEWGLEGLRPASLAEALGPPGPALRNLLVSPVTEELSFRSCLSALVGGSLRRRLLGCPLFFSAAHLHHALWRLRRGESGTAALVGGLFQASYTALFGLYAGWLFWRSGRVWGPIAAHVLCNALGFPPLHRLPHLPTRPRALLAALYLTGALGFAFLVYRSDLLFE